MKIFLLCAALALASSAASPLLVGVDADLAATPVVKGDRVPLVTVSGAANSATTVSSDPLLATTTLELQRDPATIVRLSRSDPSLIR